jgi:glucose-1-phosphate thymidylyltransferase|tara:strand:+ start:1026 stop:1907 length:882 start_codon:yes stop_codon:yes gene_type:complete
VKGIILAGGFGTRLQPLTKVITKQLLPVYDKPMIYYPLATLMLAGIKEILLICKQEDHSLFERLFSDGSHLGLQITYKVQKEPKGIAEAFIIGEEFIGEDDVCLILGDNIFYGDDMPRLLRDGIKIVEEQDKAVIFGYHVNNPKEYGVVEYERGGNVVGIEEKPQNPKSNCAAVGLYMYDNSVVDVAKQVKPSHRGELEITSINNVFLEEKKLKLKLMGRGYAWLDAGSADSLLDASQFIQTIESRQGLKIACIEEIAYRKRFITKDQLIDICEKMQNNSYGDYLRKLVGKKP